MIKDGEQILLTAKEHILLSILYRNAGRIITIDVLCKELWGDNYFGYENSLMAHISRVRQKIEKILLNPFHWSRLKDLDISFLRRQIKMKSVPKLIGRFIGILFMSLLLLIILNVLVLSFISVKQLSNSSPYQTAEEIAVSLQKKR